MAQKALDKKTMESIVKSVDKEIDGVNEITVINAKKRPPLPNNIMVMQTFAFLSATKMKPATNQVLMLFFSKSEYENYIGMDILTISEEIGVSERTVIKSLKELEEYKVIIKTPHPSDKRRHDYFINPMAAWRGNSLSRKKQIQKVKEVDPSQLQMFGLDQDSTEYKLLAEPKKNKFNK